MTKRRDALTFERGLLRVADLIGWVEVARITGKSESAVRNWSDPDTSAGITLAAALALDVAFHAAGGEGAPLLQVYQHRHGIDCAEAVADRAALAAGMADVARKDGEAIQAGILAALPGSSDAQLAAAELRLEESIAAEEAVLTKVHALRHRAPEVAPPERVGAS
jgi:hypothetical protein